MVRSLLLGLVAGLLAGCGRTEAPAGAPAAPPSTAIPSTPVADGRAALEPVSGDGPTEQAVRDHQAAVQKLPDHADSWVRLAEAWVKHARHAQQERLYGRAEAAARRALALEAGHPRARRVLALVFQNAHRFQEMQALAAEMTRATPQDADGWGLLCDAHLELGQYREAEAACQQMVDRAPGLPAWVRAAWLRWVSDDAEGALELWREALQVAPVREVEPRAWVLSEIGHLEWNRGRLDEAAQAYAAALALMPAHGPSLFGRGRVALARGDAAAAVTDLEASAAARTSEVTAAWLAAAQRAAGQSARADALEATLAAAGDFDDPRSTAQLLATLGRDPERAVALAQRDHQARGDVFSEATLAFALARAGRGAEAGPLAERAVRLNTPDPLLLAQAGLALLAAGRDGRPLLTRALGLNPLFDPRLAPQARRALETRP